MPAVAAAADGRFPSIGSAPHGVAGSFSSDARERTIHLLAEGVPAVAQAVDEPTPVLEVQGQTPIGEGKMAAGEAKAASDTRRSFLPE